MSVRSLVDDIHAALLTLVEEVPDLQVTALWNDNPTPPAIDMYPGNPFQDGAAFGVPNIQCFFTVRARVGTTDMDSAMNLLYRFLDVQDAASVEAALSDVAVVTTDGVSGFVQYPEDSGASERLLGAEWRVTAFT